MVVPDLLMPVAELIPRKSKVAKTPLLYLTHSKVRQAVFTLRLRRERLSLREPR